MSTKYLLNRRLSPLVLPSLLLLLLLVLPLPLLHLLRQLPLALLVQPLHLLPRGYLCTCIIIYILIIRIDRLW